MALRDKFVDQCSFLAGTAVVRLERKTGHSAGCGPPGHLKSRNGAWDHIWPTVDMEIIGALK